MAERQPSGGDDERETAQFMRGFGERPRLLRQAWGERYGTRHHTRARWAERLNASPAMYGRWEAGENLPKFKDLERVSRVFRVDPNYLILGVLSPHLEQWLYASLQEGNPRLVAEADYWRNQNSDFVQANQVLQDEADRRLLQRRPGASFVQVSEAASERPPKKSTNRNKLNPLIETRKSHLTRESRNS
jgi:transcriptional regulator with XRE-family HTH domain